MTSTLKVLMVTPELAPFASVGGLGDAVGSLTKALGQNGLDVRVVMPLYGFMSPDEDWVAKEGPMIVNLAGEAFCRVWETGYPGSENVKIYCLEYNKYFQRHEIYTGPWGSHGDNNERFAFLSRAALDLCHFIKWYPDIMHCHDWTTGLVPVFLNTTERETALKNTASVVTIHNLQHQGIFEKGILDFAGLHQTEFRSDSLESLGCVNFLKGGLYHANKITTVSPQYAQEIRTAEFGCGLDPVLNFRGADLIGVLNGIDTQGWNPETDPYLPANYSTRDFSGKAACKEALQRRFGLEVDPHIPIFCAIARLYWQKGIDLLADIIPGLLSEMKIQVLVLGSGEHHIEWYLSDLCNRYPGKVGVYIGYDKALSHLMEAGSDFFVMPSRFEPCGLNQMYSMRYGTVPVARSTGGLVNTIDQYNESDGSGTGFRFEEASCHGLYYSIGWACSTYYDRPQHFLKMRKTCMEKDFSWKTSALHYNDIYNWAISAKRPL
ncbi:MAG: glycogen synthase [Verrucomicrobia bacterium GWF2_51_19]|nr:MAG: glycogen synthase [Verrucomicrobia bacterium GWF2_51_19]HCJ11700.1 glycogen synthase GlgA [Opitutae bacterium]